MRAAERCALLLLGALVTTTAENEGFLSWLKQQKVGGLDKVRTFQTTPPHLDHRTLYTVQVRIGTVPGGWRGMIAKTHLTPGEVPNVVISRQKSLAYGRCVPRLLWKYHGQSCFLPRSWTATSIVLQGPRRVCPCPMSEWVITSSARGRAKRPRHGTGNAHSGAEPWRDAYY
jgi:hypothetical protein